VSELPEYLIPVLIFAAEVCVVTVGTLRIIFVSRGQKILAPLLGFFEILIWLFAIGQTMQNLNNVACFLAFALGFTLGNWLGILIEKKLAMGTVIVRVITHRDAADLIAALRAASFGVTCVDGHGAKGKVQIVLTVVKRKQLAEVVALIEAYHPHAFYAVDELQTASEGIFPAARKRPGVLPSLVKDILPAHGLRAMLQERDDGTLPKGTKAA
jgi:uncharacterized protein YebE (UPF0316 family)